MKTKIIKIFILACTIMVSQFSDTFGQGIELGEVGNAAPDSVQVPLTFVSPGELGSISLTINYDTNVLVFADFEVTIPFLGLQFGTLWSNNNPGELIISWFAVSPAFVPVIDSTAEYGLLKFGYTGCLSPVTFDTALCSVTDYTNVLPIPGFYFEDGMVYDGSANSAWLTSAADNDWNNAANWDNGIPGCGTDVFIADAGENFPIIPAGETDARIKNLTIESLGALSILGSLEVFEDLILEPDASLITADNLTVHGTTHVTIMGTGNQYKLLSSPVDTAYVSSFNGDPLQMWDETQQLWMDVTDPNMLLNPGTGYRLLPSANTEYLLDSGFVNSGDLVIDNLTYTNGPNPNLDGYNLVGNPYPSALLFDPASWDFTDVDPTAWVFNPLMGNYMVSGATLPEDIIPQAQGFLVRTLSDATGSLTIPQDSRIHGLIPMYKSAIDNRITFTVEGNDYADQMAITLNDATTPGYDPGFDAYKLRGLQEAPQLYSLIDDEVELTSNTQPFTLSVNFNLEVGADGEYTITAEGLNNFDPMTLFELEDLLEGEVVNLNQNNSYTFDASVNDDPERFVIHFGTIGIDQNHLSDVKIFGYDEHIYVSIPANTSGEIQIFNTLGQNFWNERISGNGSYKVPGGSAYLVRVILEDGIKTEKVFVQ
jgi:hypothetical protein